MSHYVTTLAVCKNIYCTTVLLYNTDTVLFLQRKTNPLDFAEQCRLVRSGDPVIDSHCLPSCLEGEMGELVDQHRLACHYVYFQCVKLCEKYGIPISERALKRGMRKNTEGVPYIKQPNPNSTSCFSFTNSGWKPLTDKSVEVKAILHF